MGQRFQMEIFFNNPQISSLILIDPRSMILCVVFKSVVMAAVLNGGQVGGLPNGPKDNGHTSPYQIWP